MVHLKSCLDYLVFSHHNQTKHEKIKNGSRWRTGDQLRQGSESWIAIKRQIITNRSRHCFTKINQWDRSARKKKIFKKISQKKSRPIILWWLDFLFGAWSGRRHLQPSAPSHSSTFLSYLLCQDAKSRKWESRYRPTRWSMRTSASKKDDRRISFYSPRPRTWTWERRSQQYYVLFPCWPQRPQAFATSRLAGKRLSANVPYSSWRKISGWRIYKQFWDQISSSYHELVEIWRKGRTSVVAGRSGIVYLLQGRSRIEIWFVGLLNNTTTILKTTHNFSKEKNFFSLPLELGWSLENRSLAQLRRRRKIWEFAYDSNFKSQRLRPSVHFQERETEGSTIQFN